MINQQLGDSSKFSKSRAAENTNDNRSQNAHSSHKVRSKKKIEMFYVTENFYKKEVVNESSPCLDSNLTPKILKDDKIVAREHGSQNFRSNLVAPKIESPSLQFSNKKSVDYHNIQKYSNHSNYNNQPKR